MTSELADRHLDRMKARLDEFEQGGISLQQLIGQLEALLGLILDDADPEWVSDLEAECNRLEFAYAAALSDDRKLSEREVAEIHDAIQQLRLMLTRY